MMTVLLLSFFYGSRNYFRARCIRSFIYPHPFSISSGRPFPLGVLLLHCCYLDSQLAFGRPAVPYVGVLQHIACRLSHRYRFRMAQVAEADFGMVRLACAVAIEIKADFGMVRHVCAVAIEMNIIIIIFFWFWFGLMVL